MTTLTVGMTLTNGTPNPTFGEVGMTLTCAPAIDALLIAPPTSRVFAVGMRLPLPSLSATVALRRFRATADDIIHDRRRLT